MKPIKNLARFNKRDQVLFFQELGELLSSGYSIAQSIDILASAHQKWQSILSQVQEGLSTGQTFYQALEAFISPNILLQLRLSDQHGDISNTLVRIGQTLAKFQQQQSKLSQVIHHPIILLGILGLLLIGLKCFLYPMINQWRETNQEAINYPYAFIFCTGLLTLTFLTLWLWYWHHLSSIQQLNILAKVPFVGTIVRSIVTYQVSQQLSMLMFSGLTLPEIIDEVAQQNNKSYAVALAHDIQKHLKLGGNIERYILSQSFVNDSLAGYFIRGHKPKILARYLDYYAKTQFKLLMQQTDRFIGTLQPLFFGIIGVAIVGLYMSMLLPMYQTIGGLYQ